MSRAEREGTLGQVVPPTEMVERWCQVTRQWCIAFSGFSNPFDSAEQAARLARLVEHTGYEEYELAGGVYLTYAKEKDARNDWRAFAELEPYEYAALFGPLGFVTENT